MSKKRSLTRRIFMIGAASIGGVAIEGVGIGTGYLASVDVDGLGANNASNGSVDVTAWMDVRRSRDAAAVALARAGAEMGTALAELEAARGVAGGREVAVSSRRTPLRAHKASRGLHPTGSGCFQ